MANNKRVVEQLVDCEAPTGKRRQVKRNGSDAAVQRVVDLHFSEYSHTELHATGSDGNSLWGELRALKCERKDNRGRVSNKQIHELQSKYAPAHTPRRQLKIKSQLQEVDLALDDAIGRSIDPDAKTRTREPLYALLRQNRMINQKMLVVLLRSICSHKPSTSEPVRRHCLEIMKYLYDSGMWHTYREECTVFTELWDDTLLETYLSERSECNGLEDFWAEYQRLTHMIGLFSHLEIIMNARGYVKVVRPELEKVLKSSKLCKRMFAGSVDKLKQVSFMDDLDGLIDKYRKDPESLASIAAFKDVGNAGFQGNVGTSERKNTTPKLQCSFMV